MFRKIFIFIFIYFIYSKAAFSEEMDFDAFRMLNIGASESYVIEKAGAPDKEVIFYSTFLKDQSNVRQFLYIPFPGAIDPHFTVITFVGSIVTEIERGQVNIPSNSVIPGQLPYDTYFNLRIGMSEGELLARAGFPAREYLSKPETDNEGRTILVTEFAYDPVNDDPEPHTTYIYLKKGKIFKILRGSSRLGSSKKNQ